MTVYSLELILHVMNEYENLCKLGSGRWYNPRNKEKMHLHLIILA